MADNETPTNPTSSQVPEAEDRYRRLFDGMLAGFALHEVVLDAAGVPVDTRFLDVNPAFERLTGLARDQVVGYRLSQVLPDTEHNWYQALGEVALTGEPKRFQEYHRQLGRHFEVSIFQPAPLQAGITFTDVSDRERANAELRRALEERAVREAEVAALLKAAQAVLVNREFENSARVIFDTAKELTGARSGYVALLSTDGEENEVLFLDAGGMPCSVDPALPMPIRGLREVAYRTGEVAYENDFAASSWNDYLPDAMHSRMCLANAPITTPSLRSCRTFLPDFLLIRWVRFEFR